jgi:hypothetical protein
MHQQQADFEAAGRTEGLVFIGRAQEKTSCSGPRNGTTPMRALSLDRRGHRGGLPLLTFCVDEDFGPFFLTFCSTFAFTARLCLNGNLGPAAGSQGRHRPRGDGQRVRRGR